MLDVKSLTFFRIREMDEYQMVEKYTKNSRALLARYSGMAMELFVLLMVLFFLGSKMDDYFSNSKPYLAVSSMVIGLIGYLYRVYRDSSVETRN